MDRDDVGLREQRVQVSKLGQVRGDPPPSRIEDSELEPAGTPRDGAADAPEPDDAERRPVTSSASRLSGQEPVQPPGGQPGRPRPPACGSRARARRPDRPWPRREPRRVRDDDVALGTGGDVDAVAAAPKLATTCSFGRSTSGTGSFETTRPSTSAAALPGRRGSHLDVVQLVEGPDRGSCGWRGSSRAESRPSPQKIAIGLTGDPVQATPSRTGGERRRRW